MEVFALRAELLATRKTVVSTLKELENRAPVPVRIEYADVFVKLQQIAMTLDLQLKAIEESIQKVK